MFREIKEWQLAKILCQSSLQPKEALTARYILQIVALEKMNKKTLHSSISDRIWDAISPKKLEHLKDVFARALQDTMLKQYSEQEIDDMLRAYDRNGSMTPVQKANFNTQFEPPSPKGEGFLLLRSP